MTAVLTAEVPPGPPDPPAGAGRPRLLVLVPAVVVPALCLAVLVRLGSLQGVELAALLFLATAVGVLLISPRGLVAARTWVVAYLVVQFPVRALFLMTAPKERPPIYAVVSPGVGLEPALVKALLQSLLGLVVLAAAYLVSQPRQGARRLPRFDVRIRGARACGLLVVGLLLLPVEGATTGDAGGGGFGLSLPGLAASGAAAVVCYAFAQSPRRYAPAFALAIAYTAARVVVLSSKMALLACLVALVVSLVGRAQRRTGRVPLARALVVGALAVVAALYVFAVSSGRSEGRGFVDSVGQGAQAAVSRSYGADALIASNAHLEDGAAPLHGSSIVEVFYSWVPRQVWPDKPRSFSIRFGEEVFSFSPSVGSEFFAPSYSGEWVLNFGTAGLVVGWALFGVGLARIDAIPSVAHRTLWLVSVVHLVEGSMVAQLWLAAPFLLGGYWVLRPLED